MGGLFGGSKVAKQAPEFASLMVQTSMWGRPIPIAFGLTRLAGNLVWYGDFTPVAHTTSTGGKGGGGGGGSTTSYTYTAAVVLALAEGPISDITKSWAGKTQGTPQTLNLTEFLGGLGQATWSYLTTNHPEQAIGYSHIAYLSSGAYDLGSAASLPNHNFEVKAPLYNTTGVSNIPDAAVDQVIGALLGNDFYGAGFPAAKLGSTTQMALYARAHGIWVSPLYVEPETAAGIVTRLCEIANTAPVFSEGILKFIPFGDSVLSGNGVTFTPNTTVLYNLTDNDFLHDGAEGNPVKITRSPSADAYNTVRINFRDRTADYSTAPMEAKETDAIQKYGLRIEPEVDYKEICDPDSARMVAQLRLQRLLYQRNTYEFTTGIKYCLLEPMDLVNLTEQTGTGLISQTVQLISIEETEDGKLNCKAQDWLGTVHSAPIYQYQTKGGYTLNLNAPPGSIEDPLIFDAPSQMCPTGYEVWVAAAGLADLWGGCDVWVSTDAASYKKIGETKARGRYGVLTSTLPVGSDPDTVSTFGVDLSTSLGTITDGTQANADRLDLLCFVGGELVSYQNETLTAAYNYTFDTYMRRGVYGTPITSHAVGADFARIDTGLFRYAYDPALIGQTVYFKFTSKNVWGGGEENLADVLQYSYTIKGPIGCPNMPASMSATVSPSSIILDWAAVGTPNLFHYEVRHGATWDTGVFVAQSLTTQLKIPPQPVGTQTWWVKSIDRAGNYSQNAVSASLSILAPSKPTVTALVVDNNLQLSWTASLSTQTILTYEVRKGSDFNTAQIVGSKNGLFTTIIENLGGTNTYWVVGVDIGGNFGTPASLGVTISAPPDYVLAMDQDWPNGLSPTDRTPSITGTKVLHTTATTTWGSARGATGYATGQWYWETHIDTGDATNAIMVGVGTLAASVTAPGSYAGIDSNGWGYYGNDGKSYHSGAATTLGATYTTGDVVGVLLDADADTVQFYKNGAAQGSPIALTAAQTWYPITSLFDSAYQLRTNFGDVPFIYPPSAGVNGLASNAIFDGGAVVMPVDLTTTFQAHFTTHGWTSPDDQVTAGFPLFGEPTLSMGYFEQVFDSGQLLGGAKITITPSISAATFAGAGSPVISIDIAVSPDNASYTNNVGVNTLFANNFRYVKVRVNVASTGDDLAIMTGLNALVEVKIKSDQGQVACLSTDSGGTTVPFNLPYLRVNSINLTPDGIGAVIPVVTFTDVPNPTSFKALLFNTSGTRISGLARWIARGY